MQNDKRLAARMKHGEKQAFTEFVDSYGARVLRLTRRYAANEPDAEDLTQEIFVDIYRSIGAFRGEAALSTWVYRIAVNRCLRYCKRARPETLDYDRQEEHASEDWHSDPALCAAKSELGDVVHDALGKLSPLHQDVVILCEMHGLTYSECAHVLDIPVGTVKSRLSNAFRRLRTSLRDYVGSENEPALPETLLEQPR